MIRKERHKETFCILSDKKEVSSFERYRDGFRCSDDLVLIPLGERDRLRSPYANLCPSMWELCELRTMSARVTISEHWGNENRTWMWHHQEWTWVHGLWYCVRMSIDIDTWGAAQSSLCTWEGRWRELPLETLRSSWTIDRDTLIQKNIALHACMAGGSLSDYL